MKERTAAYIRVSTQEQKIHGLSLDAQTQKLQDYAKDNNLDIVEWYRDEGVSGRKPINKRPELQRMIKDAQEKKFVRIIFIKLDRFFRSVGEYHACMKQISPVIWTATEEKYDLATANGRAFVNMKITIAELEADQTGERIKLVNEYKARTGLPIVATKQLPFCFEAIKKEKVAHRNEEATMYFIEEVERTHSVRRSLASLNKKYELGLSYNSAMKVLRNPMLCGAYRGNANYCDPYITKERFDELQETIKKKTRASQKHQYIFSGLIKCPVCGRSLAGKYNDIVHNKKKYSYSVYVCNRNKKSEGCSFGAAIRETKFEAMVIDYINAAFPLSQGVEIGASDSDDLRKKDVQSLKQELTRINYAWEKGRLTPEEYDRKYEDVIARIDAAQKYNETIQRRPKVESFVYPDWETAYKELDPEEKCEVWKTIMSKIEINWEVGKNGTKEVKSIDFI